MKNITLLVAIGVLLLPAGIPTARAQVSRFIVTGDSRGDDDGFNATVLGDIASATVDEGVNFILFPGDLVTGSSDAAVLEFQLTTWRNTMAPVYNAGIGVYPVRGNHDTGSKTAWDNVFTGADALPSNGPSGEENITFSFTHNNIFVAGLDQYGSHTHQVNQTWLDAQFATSTAPHVFAFGHEPAFAVRHDDCLGTYPADRNIFWDSLAAEGARAYFAGHDHFYDHARLDDGNGNPDDDLHQYIVGTAGAPLRDDSAYSGDNGIWTPARVFQEKEYGYVLVEVAGLDVTLTWKHWNDGPGAFEATADVFAYTVPEPATLSFFGLGVMVLALRRRW